LVQAGGASASIAQSRQQPRKNWRKSSSLDVLLMAELQQEAKQNDLLALWQHTTEASMQAC